MCAKGILLTGETLVLSPSTPGSTVAPGRTRLQVLQRAARDTLWAKRRRTVTTLPKRLYPNSTLWGKGAGGERRLSLFHEYIFNWKSSWKS